MNFKKVILLPINIGFLVLFTNCNFFQKSDTKQQSAESSLTQLDSLHVQLQKLANVDCENLEEIVSINEKMRRIVENVRTIEKFDKLVEAYSINEYQITLAFSDDKKIGVFSWNTQMHCLGHNIKNIALYKSEDKMVVSSLYGESMMCQEINTIPNDKGRMTYLFNGKTNSLESIITGYTITNGALVQTSTPLLKKEYVGNTFD